MVPVVWGNMTRIFTGPQLSVIIQEEAQAKDIIGTSRKVFKHNGMVTMKKKIDWDKIITIIEDLDRPVVLEEEAKKEIINILDSEPNRDETDDQAAMPVV
jgi:hypothetical protein